MDVAGTVALLGAGHEGETHDIDNLLERQARPSLDGITEGTWQAVFKGPQHCGILFWIHGADDGWTDIPLGDLVSEKPTLY